MLALTTCSSTLTSLKLTTVAFYIPKATDLWWYKHVLSDDRHVATFKHNWKLLECSLFFPLNRDPEITNQFRTATIYLHPDANPFRISSPFRGPRGVIEFWLYFELTVWVIFFRWHQWWKIIYTIANTGCSFFSDKALFADRLNVPPLCHKTLYL
jgi:hypothetical protein